VRQSLADVHFLSGGRGGHGRSLGTRAVCFPLRGFEKKTSCLVSPYVDGYLPSDTQNPRCCAEVYTSFLRRLLGRGSKSISSVSLERFFLFEILVQEKLRSS
ncbi:unnamed protein product, partial [Hapterophycus canaliculatus]